MKPGTLEQLIEKYFAGETTLGEEEQLRGMLAESEEAGSAREVREQLESMQALASRHLPEDFESRLMERLETDREPRHRTLYSNWIPVAAAVTLLFLAILFGTDLLQPKEVYGTINDPGLAFMETQKALEEVSVKMNQGLVPAKKTVDKVENSVQKTGEIRQINKALQKAGDIDQLENASELLRSVNKVYIRIGNS